MSIRFQDAGTCSGNFERFHFNGQSFEYTGCEGNVHTFDTLAECEEGCNRTLQLQYARQRAATVSYSYSMQDRARTSLTARSDRPAMFPDII